MPGVLSGSSSRLRLPVSNADVLSRSALVIGTTAAVAQAKTPPRWAAAHGNVGVARALLEAGADVNAVDADSETLLFKALSEGNDVVAALLYEAGAEL